MRRRTHWLLVEDNAAEAELARESLSHIEGLVLSVAANGAEALSILRRKDDALGAVSLVLLDLNLPGLSGVEVLTELRAEACHVPVIVLSSSDHHRDVASVYAAGANCYLVKPVHHAEFAAMIVETTRYWLTTARLPS